MKEKYKEFSEKFDTLCESFAFEDFDAKELLEVCDEVIQNYSG